MAIETGVPVVAGSAEAFANAHAAAEWIADPANNCEYPVIVKALMGEGSRGIRIVPTKEDLESQFAQASNEALSAFGDGRCFWKSMYKSLATSKSRVWAMGLAMSFTCGIVTALCNVVIKRLSSWLLRRDYLKRRAMAF